MNRWRFGLSVPLVSLALGLGLTLTAGLVSVALQELVKEQEAAFGTEIGAVKDSLVQRLTSAGETLHGMRLLLRRLQVDRRRRLQIVGNDAVTTAPWPRR